MIQATTQLQPDHQGLSAYVAARYDPTRTTTLRNNFARQMTGRFRAFSRIIRQAIVDEDCFGLLPRGDRARAGVYAQMRTLGPHAFDYPRSADKINAFMVWLEQMEQDGILEVTMRPGVRGAIEQAWTNTYIQAAYQQGITRAGGELRKAGYIAPIFEAMMITAIFNQPVHADRVGLLYTRTFRDLKGITDTMDSQISRVLAQGMAQGKNPIPVARDLVATINGPIGDLAITDILGRFIPARRRAEMLARTEIIRAHHAATIQEYRNWGVYGVSVMAEWQTAGYDVCDKCEEMARKGPYTLDEIEGMIPLHPRCRCCATPLLAREERA